MSKSIYLINPRPDAPTYFGAEAYAAYGFAPAVYLADVVLVTVAAVIPSGFDVRICDEQISPVDFDMPADFVGITGKINQERRMIELAREFRRRGRIVIFGGCRASLSPDRLGPECDILVRGEIENIADRLFGDLQRGTWQREYLGDKPDLRKLPLPRWDLYPNHRALLASMQTSRGCPFECEFCEVAQYLGRTPRHKEPGQVIAELDELYRYGYRLVFLCDDNFTAFRVRAKELLAALRDWNDARTQGRVSFSAQISADCARDPGLLRLCSDAGLNYAFVGIETPNQASLKEAGKRQNLGDIAAQVEMLLAHGIMVTGGMMVGFDADTKDIFEQQYELSMTIPVPIFTATPLAARMATPLFARLQKENRLAEDCPEASGVLPCVTNIVPARMTLPELMAGLRWLCNRLYRPEAFCERVLRLIDRIVLPAPRANSSGPNAALQPRPIDVECAAVTGRVLRLGAAEAAAMARIGQRLKEKPWATPYVRSAVGSYVQIRHIYQSTGIWDAALGAQTRPQW